MAIKVCYNDNTYPSMLRRIYFKGGCPMGIKTKNEIHSFSETCQPEFNKEPIWLGSTGEGVVTPFSTVLSQTTGESAKKTPISSSSIVLGNPDVKQPQSKFEKIIATLDYDEIKTLRRLKIDTIKDAMKSGNQETLRQAQMEFKACSDELRIRAGTLGLNTYPGVSIIQEGNKSEKEVSQVTLVKEVPQASAIKIDGVNNQVAAITTNGGTNYPMGNNRFGVSPVVWEVVQNNDSVKNVLLTLPLEAVNFYKNTAPEEKRALFNQLQEKTKVMWVTIDHKEAFINGNAYGQDTFDLFKSKIADEAKAGKISKDVVDKRLASVEVFRGMTSEQRKAVVALLEMDVNIAKL